MEGPNKLEKTNRGVNEDQKGKPLPRGLKTGKIAQKNYLQNVSVPKKGQTRVGKEGPREDCPKNWNLFLNVLLGTVVFLTFSCKSVCSYRCLDGQSFDQLFRCLDDNFLAVHNSSMGDLVPCLPGPTKLREAPLRLASPLFGHCP